MTNFAKKFSKSTGRKPRYSETSGLLPTPSTSDQYHPNTKNDHDKKKGYLRDMESVFSSQEDSLANHSPKPDEERERQMTATSGRKCYELYESFIRGGSSVKMLAASLLGAKAWYSNKCTLTWKVKGTKSNRLLFQLYPSMRRTDEIGFGLSPTPQASDATTGQIIGKEDTYYQTRGLPRKVNKNGKDGSVGLGRLVQMLKTPSASEGEGGWKVADKYWNAKAPKLKMRDQVGRKTGLKLQPAFVEWMMGYPEGWTEIPDSKLLEMRLSRKSQKK